MMLNKAVWEVYALHFATDEARKARQSFFFDSCPVEPDSIMTQDYFFWVLRSDTRVIVVDTGFGCDEKSSRSRKLVRPVELLLADLGIEAGKVEDLVMTHMHWDHAGNLPLFSSARIHVQGAELRHCMSESMGFRSVNAIYSPKDICALVPALFEGRILHLEGDTEIAPGVTAHLVGGHTPGSQVLRVETVRGAVILASDAVHYWANYQRLSPFPILSSFTDALTAFRKVETLAKARIEHIIPGHDPLIRQVFLRWRAHPQILSLHENPVSQLSMAAQ